jgi:hypothetical protein
MLFGLAKGMQTVQFDLLDPSEQLVVSETRYVQVTEGQRVAFASTGLHFTPKTHGKYAVVAKHDGKEIGRTFVHLNLEGDDDELVEEDDTDSVDDGQPDVDVVVAQNGRDDPLYLQGIRAAWEERSYPRRVEFSWLARGTRGWSGNNVIMTAFTLDDKGAIVGRSDGCIFWDLHPERPWSCVGTVSDGDQPLATAQGRYDIVFTVNDRPVAWWPMEAAIREDAAPGSALSRWLREVERSKARAHRSVKVEEPATPPKKGAAPAKPAAPKPEKPAAKTP